MMIYTVKPACVALVAAALCAVPAAAAAANMNGEYFLSATPGASDTQRLFPTNYRDYPGGVESFDVYSPLISQLYSQVFWTGLPPVDLPAEIVERFKGKGMAIVGFEMDQVRKTDEGDVSVPINVAYNHHFETTMVGADAHFENVQFDGPDDPRIAELAKDHPHGLPSTEEHWTVVEHDSSSALPSSVAIGGGNGGEYRKTFHGFAPGFAHLLDSPTQIQITPMQIDTWNRDKMNVTGGPFVPGPLPRNSLAPTDKPLYSGLLECPVTTRIEAKIEGGYAVAATPASPCSATIASPSECFAAALGTLAGAVNVSYTADNDSSRPEFCSLRSDASTGALDVFFNTQSTSVNCGDGDRTTLVGRTADLVDVTVQLDDSTQQATITLTGPSDVWFGVGFNASAMKDSPWAIVVEGTGDVSERKLEDQNPGSVLAPSVTIVSNSTADGLRTVVLTRPMQAKGDAYYNFSSPTKGALQLPFINALGSGPLLVSHKTKQPASLTLLPTSGAGACLCASHPVPFGKAKGTIEYIQTAQPADKGTGKVTFTNVCEPQPRSDMLAMKNPTCDPRTYTGGQLACHHMWSLLDADQEIPWEDQPLEYHLKFRFWVQDYNASYHTKVKRETWGIASPTEYDVPKCAEGVMGCKQNADGTWTHTITGTYEGGGKLAAAHFHCHAPTCLSVAMYRNDTGELLCEEKPIFGGTGKETDPTFDEPGFIAVPPCLWGSPLAGDPATFGLTESPDLNGVTLHSVKTSEATYGHHGEMAWQQMYFY